MKIKSSLLRPFKLLNPELWTFSKSIKKQIPIIYKPSSTDYITQLCQKSLTFAVTPKKQNSIYNLKNIKIVATTMLYLSALICFHIQSKSLFTVMLKKHHTPQILWFHGLSEVLYFSLDSKTTVSTCKETIILININSHIFIQFGNRTYWELTLSAI